MKIIGQDMKIYEINEDEVKRMLGIPESYRLADAKIIERAKDTKNPEHRVLGLRFHARAAEVTRVNLEYHWEKADGGAPAAQSAPAPSAQV